MMRVIVADDEIRVCKLICNLVDWAEFDMQIVDVAHDGLQVLEMIEKHKPDLVVTDIRMPSMDGLETIKQVKRVHPNIDFIIISGYRDFEYAQTAIKYGVGDYLLKPLKKDELKATLERLRQRWRLKNEKLTQDEELKFRLENDIEALRGGYFRDVLIAEEPLKLSSGDVNKTYHYEFKPGLFQAFIIKMDAVKPDDLSDNGLKILKEKLTKLIKDNFTACFEAEMYFSRCWVYGMLNFASGAADDIKRRFFACVDGLAVLRTLYENMEFTIGLGPDAEDICSLHGSMKSAKAAVQQRLITPSNRVLEHAPSPVINRARLLGELKAELSVAVELLDAAKAEEAIDRLAEAALSAEGVSGQEVFDLVIESYELYYVTLRPYKDDLSVVREGIEIFERNAECFGRAKELFGFLKETIAGSVGELYEEYSLAQTRPIRKAKEFIRQHYMEPISLEEVSGVVAFNSSYFSTLFKKECGVTFLEYLTQVRIEKAKELIKDTDMSIADLSCSVGYLDVKHFNKTFKKYASISPAEFRKLYS